MDELDFARCIMFCGVMWFVFIRSLILIGFDPLVTFNPKPFRKMYRKEPKKSIETTTATMDINFKYEYK